MLTFSVLALALSAQTHGARNLQPSTGRVLVVGGAGGIATIQAAVDDANDGDTILVRSGVYTGDVAIVDKGLFLVADEGATVRVNGSLSLRDLAASKSALVAGLTVWGASDTPSFSGTNDAGGLRIDECTFQGGSEMPAVVLDGDSNVALVMCTLVGGYGRTPPGFGLNGTAGHQGLLAHASSVAIQDSRIDGGFGGQGAESWVNVYGGTGGTGGSGIEVDASLIYISGSEIRGGHGGSGGDHSFLDSGYCTYDPPGDGGVGGVGILVTSAPVVPCIRALGSNYWGGEAGYPGVDHTSLPRCTGDGSPGLPGAVYSGPAGTIEFLGGYSPRMIAPRVGREGSLVTFQCYGQANDVVQIYASAATNFLYRPTFHGVELVSIPQAVLVADGVVSASGQIDLQWTLPSAPRDATPLYFQAYFKDPNEVRFVSTQITLVDLDPRF